MQRISSSNSSQSAAQNNLSAQAAYINQLSAGGAPV